MPSIAWWIGSITFSTSFEQWVGTKVYWLSSLGQVLFIHFPFNLCTTPIQICSPPLSTHSVSPEAELLRQRQPAPSSSSFPLGLANGEHQEEGTHRGDRCLFPIFYWRAPPPLGRPPHSLSVSRFSPSDQSEMTALLFLVSGLLPEDYTLRSGYSKPYSHLCK